MTVAQVNLRVAFERAARSPVGWRRLLRLAARWVRSPVQSARALVGGLLHQRSAAGPAWWRLPRSQRLGVNVVGFVDGELGLGVMARSLLSELELAGIPYRIVANEVRGHSFVRQPFHDRSCAENFPVNIAVTTPDRWQIDALRLGMEIDLRLPTIGYVAWELEKLPPEFARTLALFDEVWGISGFCAVNICQPLAQVPLCLPIRIEPPQGLQPLDIGALGLEQLDAQHAFLVGFCFDAASFVERKNPLDVLRAFQEAFPQNEKLARQPHLILKTHNTALAARQPHWQELTKLAATDERVHIVDSKLSTQQTWRLLMAFDCYVSLHRAEGLGLTVGEALALGKPTICTTYGGVMDYADQPGFMGVGYQLIPIESGQYVGGAGFVWAQPDWREAAVKLRVVYNNIAKP